MAKVEIRGIIDGLDVESFSGYDITEVMVPQSLMSKGMAEVFPNSYGNLTTIRCAPDVTSIDNGSLTGCNSLEKFQFSNAIYSIADAAFDGIVGIEHVVYGNSTPAAAKVAAIAPNATKVEWIDGCTQVAYQACQNATSITTAIVPSSLVKVSGYSFDGCTALKAFNFSGIETIDDYSFRNCTALESIAFTAALRSLGYNAFLGCTGIVSLDIGNIANWCKVSFVNADSNPIRICNYPKTGGVLVTAISNPSDVPKISSYAFSMCLSLETLSLNSTTTEVGDYAFDGCTNLSSASSANLETIGQYAFRDCAALTSIDSLVSKVKSIGQYAFSGCGGIASVTIPETCQTISANAFMDCPNLTTVTIEDGVTTIGNYAFAYCSNLTSVTIPPSVTSISATAFTGTGLTSIATDDGMVTLKGGIVIGISASATSIDFTNLTVNGNRVTVQGFQDGVFDGKTGITALVLPPSMRIIPSRCFRNLTNLSSVSLPQELTTIGNYAFQGCSSLTAITLPDTVKSIGEGAFFNTSALVSVFISSTSVLETIGASAFYGSGIRTTSADEGQTNNFFLPQGIKSIGTNAFQNCVSLLRWGIRGRSGSFTVDGVVGDGAFKGCSALTTASFGNSVLYIGEKVFDGCTAMEYDLSTLPPLKIVDGWIVGQNGSAAGGLTIPSTIRGIAQRALSGWANLVGEVTIGSGVKICNYSFENCSNVKKATIGFRTEIADGVFSGCSKLESVVLPNGLMKIGANVFSGTSALNTMTFPASLTEIGNSAFRTSGLTSLTIPDGVTSIGEYCFYNCWNMTTATLGAGITKLSRGIFGNDHPDDIDGHFSHLTTVKVEGEIHDIGREAFQYCFDLKNFAIPKTTTSIGEHAFFECENLQRIDIPGTCKSIGYQAFCAIGAAYPEVLISIAEGVESFGDGISDNRLGVFRNCISLKKIRFPSTVINMGNAILRQCSALEEVTFVGNSPKIAGNVPNPFGSNTTEEDAIQPGQVHVSVPIGSTGWGVQIPGTWYNQPIRYLDT